VTTQAPPPQFTARQLLGKIRRAGGRIYRMPEFVVFVLTDREELAQWLLDMGGRGYSPPHDVRGRIGMAGEYERVPGGVREWDILIHTIPVRGLQTIHEAAVDDGRYEVAA
jgi:hypothetical protein